MPSQFTRPSSISSSSRRQERPDVLKRLISTVEKVVLFFVFDFTVENWKQYLPLGQQQNLEINYRKVTKECIQHPSNPPRNSPRKNVRGKIKTFDKRGVEMQKRRQEKNKKWRPSKSYPIDDGQNGGVLETINESVPQTPVPLGDNAAMRDSGFNSPEISNNFNPFALIIEPLMNLWSTNNSSSSLADLANDELKSEVHDDKNLIGDQDPQKPSKECEIEELRKRVEEILIENPENFVNTEIVQELVAKIAETEKEVSESVNPEMEKHNFGGVSGMFRKF